MSQLELGNITMLTTELLNSLHLAELKLKYVQFFTDKILSENSNDLTSQETSLLTSISRVLNHPEAEKRFKVISISLRCLIIESESTDPKKFSKALDEFLDHQVGTDPFHKSSLDEGDYNVLALIKASLNRKFSKESHGNLGSNLEVRFQILNEMALGWSKRVMNSSDKFDEFLVAYEAVRARKSVSPPNFDNKRGHKRKDVAMNNSLEEEAPSTQEETQLSGSQSRSAAVLGQSQPLAPLQSTHPDHSFRAPSITHADFSPRVRLNPYARSISPSMNNKNRFHNSSNGTRAGSFPLLAFETVEQEELSLTEIREAERKANLAVSASLKLKVATRATKLKLQDERRKSVLARMGRNSKNVEEDEDAFSDLGLAGRPASKFEGVIVEVRQTSVSVATPSPPPPSSRKPNGILRSITPLLQEITSSNSNEANTSKSSSDSIIFPPGAQPQISIAPTSSLEFNHTTTDTTTSSSFQQQQPQTQPIDVDISTSVIFETFTQAQSPFRPVSSGESNSHSQSQSQSQSKSQSLENKDGTSLESDSSYISEERAEAMHLAVQDRKLREKEEERERIEREKKIIEVGMEMEVHQEGEGEVLGGRSFGDLNQKGEVGLSDEEEVRGFAELASADSSMI